MGTEGKKVERGNNRSWDRTASKRTDTGQEQSQQRADGGVTELRRRERRLGWGCSRQQPPSDQVETQTKTGNRELHWDNDESALTRRGGEFQGSGIGTCMPLPNNDINQIKLGITSAEKTSSSSSGRWGFCCSTDVTGLVGASLGRRWFCPKTVN